MRYDVAVIGAGLSGLTAASLLAKRGLKVAVIDKGHAPGGSCGAFKRSGAIVDQGASMLFGFGERGFNAHRFVFNCLEEPIDVVRHNLLYVVRFQGKTIRFWPDVGRFAQELAEAFPSEREAVFRFYQDMEKLYRRVMLENPNYTTPDEAGLAASLRGFIRHPLATLRFLGYLNRSAESLLSEYFKDPMIFKFFDQLTSTYCYTTVAESPAILAAVMFVENHIGGSYYPAGSTLFLPGKLEKVIEEHGGDMIYGEEVTRILFRSGKADGVVTARGTVIDAEDVVYSGTVWNLYGKLLDAEHASPARKQWALAQVPTYASVMLYAVVDRRAIPEDTAPVELLVGNADRIDEQAVTVYIPSLDDRTICAKDEHVVMAIGPTFADWSQGKGEAYRNAKRAERTRLLAVLEKRFPRFGTLLRHAELATPVTLERYLLKNGGSVAGPKQMLGQHMLKRLHTRTEWPNLYCCGESTVMGTGTPTVTISGLSAANAILRKRKLKQYAFHKGMQNVVHVLKPPVQMGDAYAYLDKNTRALMTLASGCQFCERPRCVANTGLDIPGMMRRASVGNWVGARKKLVGASADILAQCEERCVEKARTGRAAPILAVAAQLNGLRGIQR